VVSSSDRVRAADEHALHCTALEGPAAVRISTGHASTDTPVRPKAVNSSRPANRETYDQPTMSSNTINGIPRVDLHARPLWKRNVAWWIGGQLGSTKSALALWRKFAGSHVRNRRARRDTRDSDRDGPQLLGSSPGSRPPGRPLQGYPGGTGGRGPAPNTRMHLAAADAQQPFPPPATQPLSPA
jgi:hypothetical protein